MKSSAICREWLNSLPPTQGYLKKEQTIGRGKLLEKGMPSNKDEAWRLSNFKRLNSFLSLPLINNHKDISSKDQSILPDKEKDRERIVINSIENKVNDINLPNGIETLTDIEIEKNVGKIVKSNNIKNDISVSLNQASSSNILALKVKNHFNGSLELVVPSIEEKSISTRVFLLLERGAKLDLLQVFLGNNNSAQNHLTEIKIESNVELTHGLISMGEGKESCSICTLAVEQSEKSIYSLHSLYHGWDYARFEPRIIQREGEASTIIKGLQVTKSKEQIATHSLIRFDGPNGRLDQLQKAVASENSHCIFNGSIEVPQKAQKTEAAQLSRNLLLSKRAKIDTKPELEIVADDVRCTHGATVSQLQDEELFYLLSRGIDNEHANSLLLKGYYDEIISHFPKSAKKWNFFEKLIKK
ncbi:SufD family Fe-S cluster assembly protein [Prochlorococcus marinus]|uniref:Fe-S cluster assembly protein SufD n=1 Tax=Prochlorococcus marinus XMU1408 TaxID=2213228 RepID=A0A318R7P6_PROMR|nr:SufD family Fe-S cluster assembly protein [Prochlorococcus marinus]MBW3041129.1 Fe-S cluster assembly protein SufD [Prochlorococcus marinus str. XMU1408]PYE03730.1 Fe-S cluster assembly protein SufD [Prochlorococcus marinus XMU1408]